jgi:hypothetical protein
MRKRAFIIHGYMGYPQEAWLPWLKTELEERGYLVSLPAMPNPDRPTIPEWIEFIAKIVGEPDQETVMIGHSLGGQAIVLYLEMLGAKDKSVGKTVLVASGFPTRHSPEDAEQRAEGDKVLVPWLTVGVDPIRVRKAAGKCVVILSDDDPVITVGEATAAFQANLGAQVIIEHAKGHFNEDTGLTDLPAALRAVVG